MNEPNTILGFERLDDYPTEVKPCPFCGSHDIAAGAYDTPVGTRWYTFCLGCLASMNKGYIQTKQSAVEAWNHRCTGETRLVGASRVPGAANPPPAACD